MHYNSKKNLLNIFLFGAAGDLSFKKLIPSFFNLYTLKLFSSDVNILCVDIQNYTDQSFKQKIYSNLLSLENVSVENVDFFLNRISYIKLDLTDSAAFKALIPFFNPAVKHINYFSISPKLYIAACAGLASNNIISPLSCLIIEKPIGQDQISAANINECVEQHFNPKNIFRIDHYLGKKSVQDLLQLRFSNHPLFSNWSKQTVEHVQITLAETIGIENRWGYFNVAGQITDMAQNHLLQLLCVVAMKQVDISDATSLQAAKSKVLRSLYKINQANVASSLSTGQYAAGEHQGDYLRAYLEEAGATASSNTETFIAAKALLDNSNWNQVPFYLRTGKRMPVKSSEIVIVYKKSFTGIKQELREQGYDRLVIKLDDSKCLRWGLADADFNFAEPQLQALESDVAALDAYESLIMDAIAGKQTWFLSKDEIDLAWAWIDSIKNILITNNIKPQPYKAGSWGPSSASDIVNNDNNKWSNITW